MRERPVRNNRTSHKRHNSRPSQQASSGLVLFKMLYQFFEALGSATATFRPMASMPCSGFWRIYCFILNV